MIKYLYTDGCSHTAGGGMEIWKNSVINAYKEMHDITLWNERDVSWPKLLANHLKLKLDDKSESGAGADRVWRQAWEYCNTNMDRARQTLFILEIPSYFNRLDIRDTWEQKWLITNPEWKYEDAKVVDVSMVVKYDGRDDIANIQSKKYLLKDYLHTFFDFTSYEQSIYFKFAGLFSFFEKHNIQFFVIPNGIHPNIFLDNYGINITPNLFKITHNKSEHNEFTDFVNKHKLRICDDLDGYNGNDEANQTKDTHPGYYGHKLWAELTANYIRKYLMKYLETPFI